jgi:Ca2+-binding RTX toxin-like protein
MDIEKLIGGSQADVLQGNTLDNTISGGGGDDIIDGNGGVNWVLETADADFVLSDSQLTIGAETDSLLNINHAWLIGGAGNNLINASAFTLGWVYLEGLQGDDTLLGGSHGDVLQGGEDDDILEGGDGNDFLDAGLGDDTYVYDLTNPQGADWITESEGEGLDTVTGLDPLEFDVNIDTPQVIGPNLTITLLNEDPLSPDSVIEAVISP